MADDKLPTVFRKSPPYTASYDWLDATSGCGYRRYYGAARITAASAYSYFLTTRAVDSDSRKDGDDAALLGIYTNLTGGAEIDADFDITFQVPAVVGNGDAIINCSIMISGGDDNSTGTINIYHVRGVTETSIGTISTPALQSKGAADTYFRLCLKVAITKTLFAVGDILRINYISTLTNDGLRLYHDPGSSLTLTDPDNRTIGSDFTADIPFVVDL